MRQDKQSIPTGTIQYTVLPGLGYDLTVIEVNKLRRMEDWYIKWIVVSSVCTYTRLTPQQLDSTTRKGFIPTARFLCMYYLYIYAGLSLKHIARLLRPKNPLDHASVVHGREVIKEALKPGNKDPFSTDIKNLSIPITLKIKQLINESNSSYG